MTDWLYLLKNDLSTFNKEFPKIPVEKRTMFKGADLSGSNLLTAELMHADFTGTNLNSSQVSGYILSTCRLENTVLKALVFDDDYWIDKIKILQLIWKGNKQWNAQKAPKDPLIITQACFSEATFKQMDFSDISFTSCLFNTSHFEAVNLNDTSFNASLMLATQFKDINTYKVSFQRANMSSSQWIDMTIQDSKFNESKLSSATFKNVHLNNVSFNDAHCVNVVFENCTFNSCLFFDTNLTQARFFNCQFKNSDFKYGITEGIQIE